MRKNFPINNNELRLQPDQYLISKTDLKGRIVYANPAFIEVSGFTREELIGKAHNVVRHPDMPPAAFADLWNTLQSGRSWLGMVKNRRKDGGYYWVEALVSPIIENEQIMGYSSIRVCPTDEQIHFAAQCYEKINNNNLKGHTLKEGRIVATGWGKFLQWLSLPFQPTLNARIFWLSLVSVFSTLIAAYFALAGTLNSQLAPWFSAFIAVAVFIVLFANWRLSQRAALPLKEATHIAQQIAAGNLLSNTDAENTHSADESKELFFALSIMRKGLSAIADDTHVGIRASMQVAQEIHNNNQLLASRTQNQADSLQQTAASMEELTITVQQNADNTREATGLAEHSMNTAQQGGSAVQALIVAMQDIHNSSKRIADIVTLIDSIAFQTNILALNAAVESARAGEAGRGFAVVAGEVRSLAQRSAQAANDIKSLIDQSVTQVSTGVNQAEQAGNTMQDVVQAVNQVNQIITEIASASSEQATGLHQIHQAVTQIDDVTQQNSSLVNELGATVQLLSGHADSLDQAIRVLNTDKTPDLTHNLRLN